MADNQKVTALNVTGGPKVLNSIPPRVLQPGEFTGERVEITAAEFRSMSDTGYFEFEGGTFEPATEPGPLDGSVEELTAHLATIDNADEVQKLIEAETAGKSRKGALSALDARRDEILAK